MTDSGNDPQLQDLEPLDPGAMPMADAVPMPSMPDAMMSQGPSAGLPPPAFNQRCVDKMSYRFLMCGVLMVLGCLMPFSADINYVGYKTMSGAVFLFIGLGMVWTWWAAIHNNRSTGASLKWLLLCFIPLLAQTMNLIGYDAPAAIESARQWGSLHGNAMLEPGYGWNSLFGDMGLALSKKVESADAAMRVELFFRAFGTGRFFVFLGALLAEFFVIAGIAGGAKKNKEQKQARMTQAAERKRR